MDIKVFGITDPGLKRTNNEDSFIISLENRFCAVADGMGGAAAGEVASSIFVSTANEIFSAPDSNDPAVNIQKTFLLANSRILEHVSANPEHKGMGTTAELLAWTDDIIIIGHVGDSRTYRFRNGTLKQVTKDHSLIQMQLDQGIIAPEDAKKHRMRHVILRAVGVDPDISLDIIKSRLFASDIYLLCSDGLSDMAEEPKIEECMKSNDSLEATASALINLAKEGGGKDNITAVLVKCA